MNGTWIDLLDGSLSADEESALVASTASRLDSFLESHPNARSDVSAVITTNLDSTSLDDRAWDTLVDALDAYFDVDFAYMLSWLAYSDRGHRMEVLREVASTKAVDFVRALLGLHGSLIRRAMVLQVENPDDWQSAVTYVVREQLTQMFRLKLDVTKYTGDRVTLEGPPDSMLALVGTIIGMLNSVGDRTAFAGNVVDEFLGGADELVAFLRTDVPVAPVELTPTAQA